jgi:hypothetical protein
MAKIIFMIQAPGDNSVNKFGVNLLTLCKLECSIAMKKKILKGVQLNFLFDSGSAKANGREPKNCFGRVFNYKLGCFEDVYETHVCERTPTSVVENSAQISSC